MADEEQIDEAAEGEVTEGGGKSRKGLVIGLVAMLVLGGGGFGAWKFLGGKSDGKAKVEEKLPPRYVTLDPPFVVNFEAESVVRFLQVTIDVMTRDASIETLIKSHDPRVRNDLLMILGNQSYSTVSTLEGKEALRKRSLDSVKAIVQEMGGDPAKLEALYFTSFVMQ